MKIPLSKPQIGRSALRYIARAIARNEISKGEYVEKFEKKFAQFAGFKHAVSAVNGTLALYIALRALEVKQGDEVILPALTFAATADAIMMCGATPIFADIEGDTFSLDTASVEQYLTKKTKVILSVDIYGIPANVKRLRRFNLPIIADSCESLGTHRQDADITCFSFFGNKVMTTGEGGMACTDSPAFRDSMRMLRNHGRVTGFWHTMQGTNARMSNITAALGLSQLEMLPGMLKRRAKVLGWYGPYTRKSAWLLPRGVDDKERAVTLLNKRGIDARIGFYPLHIMPAYYQRKSLPVCEHIGNTVILLPLYPAMTKKEVDYIKRYL
jgi:perosamine synthetase